VRLSESSIRSLPKQSHWLNTTKSNQHPAFPIRPPKCPTDEAYFNAQSLYLDIGTKGYVSPLVEYGVRCPCDRYLLTCVGVWAEPRIRVQPKVSMQGSPINEAIHFAKSWMERSERHKVGTSSFSARSFSSTPRESRQRTVFLFGAFIEYSRK
jgi:hypothetical protein